MRLVLAPPAEHDAPGPTPWQLERVRDLPAAFPDAGLREVSMLRANTLDKVADPSESTRIWLAVEAMQVTGSFKVRGALAAIGHRTTSAPIVTASAGAHGVGMAYAARVLGQNVTIFVTNRVPILKLDRMRNYGAEVVVVESEYYGEAEAQAKVFASSREADFISAHDNLDVIAGNGSSIGFELTRALGGVPDVVIAPIGGGGLATGLSWAFRTEVDEAPPAIIGVQHDGHAGLMALIEGTSGTRPADSTALARVASHIHSVAAASRDEAHRAVMHAGLKLGLNLEPSAALPLVPILDGLPSAYCGGDVVLILTARAVEVNRSRLSAAWT